MRVDPSELEGLSDLDDPPEVLFVRGALPVRPAVAIVGTRRADRGAVAFTRGLARAVAEAGAHVVSGGAEGIDAAAHAGALDAGRSTTVVQAAPLHDPYPRHHRRLFERVLSAGGGWVSETPEDEAPLPWRFLARNRIIAALADAVLVVQAPARSGALSTARFARDLGRPLFAVPAAPWDARGAGGARLLTGGARPCLGAADLLDALGLAPAEPPPREAPRRPALPQPLAALRDALADGAAHEDALGLRVGLPPPRVRAGLVQLELRGLATRGPDGWRLARDA